MQPTRAATARQPRQWSRAVRPRRPEAEHPLIEGQFGLEAPLDRRCLAEAMALTFEGVILDRDARLFMAATMDSDCAGVTTLSSSPWKKITVEFSRSASREVGTP